MRWVLVIGLGIAVVIIASSGRIPGTGRQLAVSDDTRTAAAIARTPKYTRQQAIGMVEDHIRQNCAVSDKYLVNREMFEAKWMRQPRSDDHYERGYREWTVTDPLTGAFWRLYEDNNEIIDVVGDCKVSDG